MAVKPEVNPLQLIGGRKFVAFMTTAWFFHTGQVTEETYFWVLSAYMGISEGSKGVKALWNSRKGKSGG